MSDDKGLSLGEVQKRFSGALGNIEELRAKLEGLIQAESTSLKSSDLLSGASEKVGALSSELKNFIGALKAMVESFNHNTEEFGKALASTSTTTVESRLSELQEFIETHHLKLAEHVKEIGKDVAEIKGKLMADSEAARMRAAEAELRLSQIPEKYRNKFLR